MGYRKYKNILKLKRVPDPIERRENLVKEALKDSTPLPQTLEYVDIDTEFKRWVEEDLAISYEDKELPTIALFSTQRFSEYMESWENNDDQKNLMLNFKVVTRENNPQPGTLHDKNMNVAGDRTYLMKRVVMQDKNGRIYNLDYRMRQPFCVDLIYTISIVTNKYQLLNEFNMLINKQFRAIQCYIRPNGHYIPMKLENISDESEYSMDDRQYFLQSFQIRVMAYIIQKDDLVTEEQPIMRVQCGEPMDKKNGASVELEEGDCDDTKNPYYYQPLELKIQFHDCENEVIFNLKTDFDFVVDNYVCSEEVREVNPFRLRINDEEMDINNLSGFKILHGSSIYIFALNKYLKKSDAMITFYGHNPDEVFDERKDNPEVEMDRTQFCKEVTIDTVNDEVVEEINDVKCNTEE